MDKFKVSRLFRDEVLSANVDIWSGFRESLNFRPNLWLKLMFGGVLRANFNPYHALGVN